MYEASELCRSWGYEIREAAKLEILFCEAGRVKLSQMDVKVMETAVTFPHVITGEWRTRMTPAHWSVALFHMKQATEFLTVAETNGAMYNARHSVDGLKIWLLTFGGLHWHREDVLACSVMLRSFADWWVDPQEWIHDASMDDYKRVSTPTAILRKQASKFFFHLQQLGLIDGDCSMI